MPYRQAASAYGRSVAGNAKQRVVSDKHLSPLLRIAIGGVRVPAREADADGSGC
jgi:hypothetical protein